MQSVDIGVFTMIQTTGPAAVFKYVQAD